MNRCVFLDRDGVINQEEGYYVYTLQDFVLCAGVKEALECLRQLGFLLIESTNQGGIAKGRYSHAQVQATHDHMQDLLGGMLDDIFYSPYHDHMTRSLSRKPSGYMIERAMALHGIDASASWMIGDRARDIQAGQAAGVRTLRIGSDPLTADCFSCSLHHAHIKQIGPFAVPK